jgi:ligand-binding sensor domain-containing protein/signal transduction histidine kinase
VLRVGKNLGGPVLWLLFVIAATLLNARAEQLPIRIYTTADGLPRDSVSHIKQDSRGFLWLFTGDGLTRFDGYTFRNYTTDEGLADRRVNDFLETRAGGYWIATDSGLCRFNPTGRPKTKPNETISTTSGENVAQMFTTYNPHDGKATTFNVLVEGDLGSIWCGTTEGLYRVDVLPDGKPQFHIIELEKRSETVLKPNVISVLKDHNGTLWCGTTGGFLYRLLPDGHADHYAHPQENPRAQISSLLEDRAGNIWVGIRIGLKGELLRVGVDPDQSHSIVVQRYGAKEGLAAGWINSLFQTRDGKLWAATTIGLYLVSPASDSNTTHFRLYDARNGLCRSLEDVTEDRDGNLWIASACGAQKVARNGFIGYGPADGLRQTQVNSIFEDRDGALLVITYLGGINRSKRIINRFDGARFQSVAPNLPAAESYPGWGWSQSITQDHLGEWWVPCFGLYRFPKVKHIEELARAHPQFINTVGEDSDSTEVFRLYEDSHGDMWIATTERHFSLLRWERATNTVHDHTAETGVRPQTDFIFFREDRAGNLWIGTSKGELLRYHNGKFRRFTTDDGVPPGWIIWLYIDHAGRLWIGSQLGGLNRIDDPTAEVLRIKKYTTLEGLSSNNIRSIIEDAWGRIYAGTGHGVDRLDVETGAVKHFTVADGLPKGIIEHAYRDRQGALWFGSMFGLSRVVPEQQESRTLPSVYITGLRIEGVARRISELGETNLPQFDLPANETQVSVDFVGLGASVGEELRYQYILEGAGREWSAPTTERTINYATLAPGTYRFQVRAINADGQGSQTPASFAFNIAAPIWMRSWFWALVTLAAGLGTYVLYRYRVARIVFVANMRTSIATDLHDDIGSGLSRMAILSEVVKQQMGATSQESVPMLTEIAESARTLVSSMRDIVWAIDPRHDNLSNVVFRVRQFASDILEPQQIKLDFRASSELDKVKLDPEQRRHLFLIFKEALNNIARHADCRSVLVEITVRHTGLTATVRDDGRGFKSTSPQDTPTDGRGGGHGLENMHLRATELGGYLTVDSGLSRGTALTLRIPLKK